MVRRSHQREPAGDPLLTYKSIETGRSRTSLTVKRCAIRKRLHLGWQTTPAVLAVRAFEQQ